MTKRTAYRCGIDSGLEAAAFGDFTESELASLDAFTEACAEICDNKRQYADHPGYDFGRQPNSENLWDAFDEGETVGIRRGAKLRGIRA